VFCRNCGYQNPEQFGFCGMCGHALAAAKPAAPRSVIEKVALSREPKPPQASRVVAQVADPVDTPPPPERPKPAAPDPKPRSDKWWVDEAKSDATISGPSFLGLSGSDSARGGGYSYLLDEEEHSSHASFWVFLALLLVLGGVVRAKWQPIRDYVLTTSLAHSRLNPTPAQPPKGEPPAAASAPALTPAGGDPASQAAITPESKLDQGQAAQSNQELSTAGKPDDSSKVMPAGANSERSADAASKAPEAKSAAAKKKAVAGQADDEGTNEEKTSAARAAKTPQASPGSELVTSGEKYLYARGVARNCSQALTYFNAAAAQKNPQAFSHLGAMYATGECVPMDRAAAYAWFRRAYTAEPGNHYFERNLTMLWREMTPPERLRATGAQ
jgi:hypothetical protein